MFQYVLNHWIPNNFMTMNFFRANILPYRTHISYLDLLYASHLLLIASINIVSLIKRISVTFCRMSRWSRFLWTTFCRRAVDIYVNKYFCLIRVNTNGFWYSFLTKMEHNVFVLLQEGYVPRPVSFLQLRLTVRGWEPEVTSDYVPGSWVADS